MKTNLTKNIKDQHGNALFLILIAVALFAALSYAVTQSGGGGGTIDREQSLISASQMTQYPALMRTTVTRMVLTGTAVSTLNFDSTPGNTLDTEVFGATGGGISFQGPPANIGTANPWAFTLDVGGNGIYIKDVGSNGATGEEVMAYLDGISLSVCTQLRKGLGLAAAIPTEGTDVVYAVYDHGAAPNTLTSGGGVSGAADDANTFGSDAGETFSCVENGTGNYVYYHALVEQ